MTVFGVASAPATTKELEDTRKAFEDAKVEFGNGTDTIVFTTERVSSTNKLIIINGIEAYEETLVFFELNITYKTVLIPNPQKNVVYSIQFFAPETIYSKYESQVDECIQSFKFIE